MIPVNLHSYVRPKNSTVSKNKTKKELIHPTTKKLEILTTRNLSKKKFKIEETTVTPKVTSYYTQVSQLKQIPSNIPGFRVNCEDPTYGI